MAECIPDKLPGRVSKGEERTFELLKRLPDECIVYYEPIIENRYPDFVVINPHHGLLIIEVKGWYAKDIIQASHTEVIVKESGLEVQREHPIVQARNYMYRLMDQCRKSVDSSILLRQEGEHKNKFIFPFAHMAILSNITIEDMNKKELNTIFSENKIIDRNKLINLVDSEMTGYELMNFFIQFFDPYWKIKKLETPQVEIIRSIIHPEIRINQLKIDLHNDEKNQENDFHKIDIKVLDLKQESNVRKIGDGHRIIYGIAGSGKTVLLIAKARLFAEQSPECKILFLCFNVTLSAYLKNVLSDCKNVQVFHFDGWSKANGVTRKYGEDNQKLGERLLARLSSDLAPHSGYFDKVMIDEAQDFEFNWFKSVLAAMKDPNDGDLIIVGDGSQGIYGNRKISWKSMNINARGRTIYARFDLDKNYRNSREIVELASIFSTKDDMKEDSEDSFLAIKVDPNLCKRSTGIKPVLIKCSSLEVECNQICNVVYNLLHQNWFSGEIEFIKPSDIAIFYPYCSKKRKQNMDELISKISKFSEVIWLTNKENLKRNSVGSPGVKIQTIHSSKGLQYKAVIIMWADLLPKDWVDEPDEEGDKRLLYVGLTRPEDYLVITASDDSTFVEQIAISQKVNVINV